MRIAWRTITATALIVKRDCRRGKGMAAVMSTMLSLAGGGVAYAGPVSINGDLEAYLNDVIIGGAEDAFQQPDAGDLASWGSVITALLSGNVNQAADLADAQFYTLIRFTDDDSGCVYYVLREDGFVGEPPFRGLGTYVYNPNPRRPLNIQAPHPIADSNTKAQAIRIFIALQATFFQMNGTHRCASGESSPCDGTTTVCTGSSEAYRITDVAHYTQNFYQVTSNAVAEFLPGLVSISVHGFTPCNPTTNTSFAVVSNGTGGNVADSIATRLAAEFTSLLQSLPNPYTGQGGGSCNALPGDPHDIVWPCDNNPFCGGTNTQGRYINGSNDACEMGVANAPAPERFIHLEQQRPLRDPPDGSGGPSWDVTIDALAAVFVETTWVDFDDSGPETGAYCQPFHTIAAAVADADGGERLRILPGTTSETPTIDKPLTLTAHSTPVTIGQ